ncbi:Rossmann-like and DUF2520 domain-containing protein [Candidatus Neomarinimicrobiota bacterium]
MNICLIGAGRVGRPLAAALENLSHTVEVMGRNDIGRELHKDLSKYELVFLTVPDQQIKKISQQIEYRPTMGVVHCSGQLANEQLGEAVAMFHPMMSFSGEETAAIFNSCPIGISGPAALCEQLEEIANGMAAKPFQLDEESKATYHMAGLFASVFPYVLLLVAREQAAAAGIPRGAVQDILGPIFLRTVEHLSSADPKQGITGPVSRGDTSTVREHLALLEERPLEQELYRQLSKMAVKYSGIDQTTKDLMLNVLEQ